MNASSQKNKSFLPSQSIKYRILSILTVLFLVISACALPFGRDGEPTSLPLEVPQDTPTTSVVDSGMEVIDDGSPLPPKVIGRQPEGAQELPTDGVITLIFDQPMDSTMTSAAWQVTGPQGEAVAGEISWPDAQTLRFDPEDPLQSGAIYQANLNTQASSKNGSGINEPYKFQFLTVGDLEVSQVFPREDVQEVGSDSVITVIFNRPVAPLVIAEESGDLPHPLAFSPPVSGKGEWVNTSVYVFQPDGYLKGGTDYTVTVQAGLADAVGESSLSEDFTWMFSTAQPAIQEFETSSGQVNPPDFTFNVLLDEYFTIRFLQPMNQTSIESALTITSLGGERAGYITEWDEEYRQVVITPTRRLALGTDYTLNLDSSAQAVDGGTLDEGLTWNFSTVPPPAIQYTRPGSENPQQYFNRDFYIKFTSPMNIESVKERITINPAPDEEIQWWYNEWDWSLSGYFLEPSTNYEVNFAPGMQDIYGNEIQEGSTERFSTIAYSPSASLLMPYEAVVMRAGSEPDGQEFYASYRNVSNVAFELHSLSASQFTAMLEGSINSFQYDPPDSTLVWELERRNTAPLNEQVVESYLPKSMQDEPLEPGFYYLGMVSPEVQHEYRFSEHRLLVVANANLTFKSSSTDSLFWLTDLESGAPRGGVSVTVYDKGYQPIGSGSTDEDGKLYLEIPSPDDPYANRFALAESDEVMAFASSQWGSGVSLWDYGVWSGYYAPSNQPKAYVYTERPIYRPGQPVYFKGIVRLDNDLDYHLPDPRMVKVQIENFQEIVYETELPLSDFGSFDGELALDSEAALGAYTLTAFLPGGDEPIGSVTFNVAEYRKPEFQVQVNADPEDVLPGEMFNIEVRADYFTGGGVSDAEVDWTLTSEPFIFTQPDEYSSYSFQDIEEDAAPYEEGEQGENQVIAQGKGRTDADGVFTQELRADLSDSKSSLGLTFEATVTDLSKISVSGRQTVVAHRSGVYPGIISRSYIGEVGEEVTLDIVTLDWDGQPLPEQVMSLSIVERRWYSVQEQDPTGRVQWVSTVEEIPVASYDDLQTDENGEISLDFIPENGGVFRARITSLDPKGNPGRASAYIWVAGEGFIPWRQTNDRSFDLVADRKNYTPGDTAEILIASPFQGEAYALVTVERGRIRKYEVLQLVENSTIYELPISADMAPNAYVSVVVVKGVDGTNPRPNFKMGITEIDVDPREQAITVELESDVETAGPGDQVLYTVRTTDYQGEPVSAEVSLSLSDLATLSLMPPNSPPILDFFYSQRTLGVWTSIPIVLSLEDYNASIEEQVQDGVGMGSGGGKGADVLGVVEVRQDFPDTAFWDATVKTADNGEAAVAIRLPDNLTTWRMDARAVTQETRVGQKTYDIISTKPLLVRPQTPRFFVANDHVRLGTAVHNNSDVDLTVKVGLSARGLTLLSEEIQTVDIPADSQVYVSWDAGVNTNAERVDLVFSAEGGGLQDASRPPLGTLEDQGIPVYKFEAHETVGTSGMMAEGGTLIEAISLPRGIADPEGGLTIKVSPSLAAGMTDGLTYLEHFPFECIEQTISRFLPNVITTRALKSAGISDPELEANLGEQVDTVLQRLYNWQNPDGGWGWWRSQKSDPLTSSYVVLGMVEAQDSGFNVSQQALNHGLDYLHTQLRSIRTLTDPDVVNRQAFILYVLGRAGEPDISRTVQLFDQRERMALYGRAFLANTLYIIDNADPRLETLLSDFNNTAILSATGSHWEESETDRWNWNTDTRTTAIILSALSILDPDNPLNANAVRWLMSNRTGGHWRGTQETAWSLMALTAWMEASGELEADYDYAVALNSVRLGGGVADSETLRQSLELKVDISEMIQEQANRLTIGRHEGPGNLYYTAHLNVALPVEEIEALDQGIVVSRSYYRLDDLEQPVVQARQGEQLLARLTIVAPNALHFVVVDDPLPAGLEAIDQSLSTSPQSIETPESYTYNDAFWRGWGWWHFTHTQLRDEKVVLSTDYLPAGTYVYTYLVRASTIGVFRAIPTTAGEFYYPEVYGRGEGSLFTVTP